MQRDEGSDTNLRRLAYVAVEGGVCAGKSTAVATATSLQGVSTLPEYMEMLPQSHAVWNELLPPGDRVQLFLQLDARRFAQEPGRTTEVLLADRSSLSIVAFEYAVSASGIDSSVLFPRLRGGGWSVRLPDSVLYFDLSQNLRRQRWAKRGGDMDSMFVDDAFNEAMRCYFQAMSSALDIEFVDCDEISRQAQAKLVEGVVKRSQEDSEQCAPPRIVPMRELAGMFPR